MAPTATTLSQPQKASLRAVIDALLPSLPVPESQEVNKATQRYWEYRLASDDAFVEIVIQSIDKLPESDRFATKVLLYLLSNPAGTSLVSGTLTLQAFTDSADPTSLLQAMQLSSIPTRRRIFSGLKRLIGGLAYSYTVAEKNPFWEAMGYPGAPQFGKSASEDGRRTLAAMARQAPVQQAVVKLKGDVDCDILVVGSGPGGSVAASVLARAGYKVLVVEKGPYVSPADVSNLEADAFDRLYEQHGLLTTSDGSMVLLAGATVGGGTSVNWGCCLPLPDYVRKEWVEKHGLEAFGGDGEYDKALNYVLIKVGALDRSRVSHNRMNKVLQEGCDVMGYRWETTGQNLRDTLDPSAGYICFGDRYGNKNAGVTVFLRDAVKNGAKIADNCRVKRILRQNSSQSFRSRAVGAECIVSGRLVRINARKAVVVAAGALHTPGLLKRSGLRNGNIGRHLHLHPVTPVLGLMNPGDAIEPHLGAPLTTVCNEFELGPQGNGYGARIECPSAHTGLWAAVMTWMTPFQYKEKMLMYRHETPLIVMQRDQGEGSVSSTRDGTPVVHYSVSARDKASLSKALNGAFKILTTGGAQVVQSSHIRDPGIFLADGPYNLLRMASDDKLQKYLAFVGRQGMRKHEIGLFSAHQMGTCRLSTTPLRGAVDVHGEAWDCDNLFVMDASTFPSAAGVNPMITVLVIAKMLSSKLALRLRYEDQKLVGIDETVRARDVLAKRSELRSFKTIALSVLSAVPHVILWVVVVLLFVPLLFGLMGRSTPSPPLPPPLPSPPTPAMTSLLESVPYGHLLPYSLMWTAVFAPIMFARLP